MAHVSPGEESLLGTTWFRGSFVPSVSVSPSELPVPTESKVLAAPHSFVSKSEPLFPVWMLFSCVSFHRKKWNSHHERSHIKLISSHWGNDIRQLHQNHGYSNNSTCLDHTTSLGVSNQPNHAYFGTVKGTVSTKRKPRDQEKKTKRKRVGRGSNREPCEPMATVSPKIAASALNWSDFRCHSFQMKHPIAEAISLHPTHTHTEYVKTCAFHLLFDTAYFVDLMLCWIKQKMCKTNVAPLLIQ